MDLLASKRVSKLARETQAAFKKYMETEDKKEENR